MSSTNTIRKAKLTITISSDLSGEIDEIAKAKGTPRSQLMEEILRDWLSVSKKKTIEKDIRTYYLSLTKEEKKENEEWAEAAAESAERTWND
ncbi:MAG: ribbon-helix-helix domain-containing protein [Actinobacteria bacterium]|nr:ribbon-helix-helix domain-containing protein [Actinomycetota bacterium]